jgi:HD-GYP domain-containing protein (c-di-GMP phosphodiesterase class II)/DNA-directed RNA polymerase subunit RPC12/RpoP
MTNSAQELRTLFTMASFVESRDPFCGGHMWRVSQFSKLLAEAADASKRQIALAVLGGFLHDIGKISIPDTILTKHGTLSDSDLDFVKTHPAVGGRMIQNHPIGHLVLDAVLYHHEMPNGLGYPQGLNDMQIPWLAKVVALADGFDAMTSTHAYRPAMSIINAMEHICMNAGTQFDHDLAYIFCKKIHSDDLQQVMGHSDILSILHDCPNCGPTITIPTNTRENDLLYCPNCGVEVRIHWKGRTASLQLTGKRGNALAMTHHPDLDIFERLIQDVAPALS